MCALQGERGPFVMVKRGWLPSRSVMTASAIRASGLRELLAVNIRMTDLAFRRCCLEIHMDEPAC